MADLRWSIGFVLLSAVAQATDVGVTPTKLVVVDKVAATSAAKVVFVAKDPAATKGSGTDVGAISARLDVVYDGEVGAFVVPAGESDGTSGWLVNKDAVAKFANKDAPGGATQVKVAVVKPGALVKVVGKGLGDAPLDILGQGAPAASVYTAVSVQNGSALTRHCSEFPLGTCAYKNIAGGTGAKLVCKGGVADASCVAAACTRTQDCPANHVCAAGECVDVTSGSIIASLIESSYLTDQCLAPVAVGGAVTGADACHLFGNGCTPGCHVDVASDAVSVTASAPGTWSTAPMLDVDVQFDASTGGPVSYRILFIAGSCTFDLTRSNLTASIGVTFAPDGTPTATTNGATLGSSIRVGCITDPPVADVIDAVDLEFTAALAAQIEAVRLALEGFLQP